MISVYDSKEKNFEKNGLGSLKDIYETLVEEELNGLYDFTFQYPINGYNVDLIKKFNIIKCDNCYAKEQLFRIKKVEPFLKYISVYCQHISYDLKNNIVEDAFPRELNGQGALDRILSKTQYPHNFKGFSDITRIGSARYVEKNPLACIIGDLDNSFLNVWGGEVERDNFLIKVLEKRGNNRGYKLSKTKNISGLDFTEDSSTIITRAFPKAYDGIKLPEIYVDSPFVNDYYAPFVKEIDCSDMKLKASDDDDGFETLEQLYEAMREKCNYLFEIEHIDRPSLNVKIDLVELSKTTLYKDYQNMEMLGLGDTVYFEYENVEYQLRVIKTGYHPILKRIVSLELGQFKSNYIQSNMNQTNNILTTLDSVDKHSFLEEAKNEISKQLAHAMGGNVYKTRNEIFIMDTEEIAAAKKVWRWNINGLGYSKTGVNGKYDIAITADGQIVADFIKVGKLDVSVIEGYNQLLLNVSKIQTEIYNFNPIVSINGTSLLLKNSAGKDLIELSISGKSYQETNKSIKNIGRIKNIFDENLELGNIGAQGENTEVPYRLRSMNYIPISSNLNYTISNDLYNGVLVVCFYKSDKTFLKREVYTLTDKSCTFTAPLDAKFLRFCNDGTLANPKNNMDVKYQIEQGNIATNYCKCGNYIELLIQNQNTEYEKQNIFIDLKNNELMSLPNTIKDEFIIKNNRAYIDKKAGKYALNGTEKIEVTVTNNVAKCVVTLPIARANNDMINAYCSHFKVSNDNIVNTCRFGLDSFKNSFIFYIDVSIANTVDTIRNFIENQYSSNKAITVIYELEDKEIVELEQTTISTYKNDTLIALEDELETNMSCKYYKNSDIVDYFSTKTDTSAQIKIASDSVMQEVNQTNQNLSNVTSETNNIKLELNKVTQNYEKIGGNNKIHDSVGRFNSSEYWENSETGEFIQGYEQSLIGRTESASKISVKNGIKRTTSKNIVNLVKNKEILLSYKLTNEENTITKIRLIGNSVLYENIVSEKTELADYSFSFIPETSSLIFEIESTTTQFGWSHISDLMLGDTKLWEQAQGETWNRIIEMNEFGQLIKSPNVKTAYFTSTEGMGLYELSNDVLGERKAKFDIDGILTSKIECTQLIQKRLVKDNIQINSCDMYIEYVKGSA